VELALWWRNLGQLIIPCSFKKGQMRRQALIYAEEGIGGQMVANGDT
jgi:hypothetical protein